MGKFLFGKKRVGNISKHHQVLIGNLPTGLYVTESCIVVTILSKLVRSYPYQPLLHYE